ncbi:MAG: GNAT family N-acetyltransferase [Steroidobacterales bacterium]
MPELDLITLARIDDARNIAEMSRELIEPGLTWAWTPARVRHFIANRDASTIVMRRERRIAAFALMNFSDESAHLTLLAVAPEHRHQGLGRQLVDWLCASAMAAGIFRINLEVRANNPHALAFYVKLGFERQGICHGYYQGREAALRMSRQIGNYPDNPQ